MPSYGSLEFDLEQAKEYLHRAKLIMDANKMYAKDIDFAYTNQFEQNINMLQASIDLRLGEAKHFMELANIDIHKDLQK